MNTLQRKTFEQLININEEYALMKSFSKRENVQLMKIFYVRKDKQSIEMYLNNVWVENEKKWRNNNFEKT